MALWSLALGVFRKGKIVIAFEMVGQVVNLSQSEQPFVHEKYYNISDSVIRLMPSTDSHKYLQADSAALLLLGKIRSIYRTKGSPRGPRATTEWGVS